jgi:aminopeptidase N
VAGALQEVARTDPNSVVRARAIELLGTYRNKDFQPIFAANLYDSSYWAAGAALTALAAVDSAAALAAAEKQMPFPMKRRLLVAVIGVLMDYGSEEQFDFIASKYAVEPFILPEKMTSSIHFVRYLAKVQQPESVKKAIDLIVRFRDRLPGGLGSRINPELSALAAKKDSEGLKDQADYIRRYLSN